MLDQVATGVDLGAPQNVRNGRCFPHRASLKQEVFRCPGRCASKLAPTKSPGPRFLTEVGLAPNRKPQYHDHHPAQIRSASQGAPLSAPASATHRRRCYLRDFPRARVPDWLKPGPWPASGVLLRRKRPQAPVRRALVLRHLVLAWLARVRRHHPRQRGTFTAVIPTSSPRWGRPELGEVRPGRSRHDLPTTG